MIPIAVVLLVLVVAFTLIVGVESQQPIATDGAGQLELHLVGLTIPVSVFGLFCSGAGAMLALVLAVVLLRSGFRRGRAARRNRKELMKAATGKAALSVDRKQPSTRVFPGRAGDASDRGAPREPSTKDTDSPPTRSPRKP